MAIKVNKNIMIEDGVALKDLATKNEIPTKTSQLTNDKGFLVKSDIARLNTLEVASIEDVKYYLQQYAPIGVSIWVLSLNGAVSCAICQKANTSYLSFLHFSYGVNCIQYKYVTPTWYTYQL